ncbi:hypothetical protein ACT691_06915 [Vibrio metschnikovii]
MKIIYSLTSRHLFVVELKRLVILCAMFNARSLPFSDEVYATLHEAGDVSMRRWRKDYREGGITHLDRRS